MKIEKITEKKDFYNLKEEWNNLLNKSNLNNIFLTWEWLYTWWEVFKTTQHNLFLLLAREKEFLIGIAPLYIYKNLFLKQLRFLGDGIICSDYLRFIVLPNFRYSVFKNFLDYLKKESKEWQFFIGEAVFLDNKEKEILINWCKENLYFIYNKNRICPYIRLPDKEEIFIERLNNSIKKEINYQIKRLKKLGKYEWASYTQEDKVKEKFEEFIRLHKKRWQDRGYLRTSPFCFRRFSDFHRRILDIFLNKNWLSLSCLNLEGRTIAMHYNFVFNHRLYHYLSAFDRNWASYSPGKLALFESIREAISKGVRIFDFLRGDELYKLEFSKTFYPQMNILIMNRGWRRSLYLFWNRLLNGLKGY